MDSLIYLDADFISLKYEIIKKVSPDTVIEKKEEIGAKVGAGLFGAGLKSSETKKYKISLDAMYLNVRDELIKEFKGKEESVPYQPVWYETEILFKKSCDVFDGLNCVPYFESSGEVFNLICEDDYFKYGYNRISSLNNSNILKVVIPVRILVKKIVFLEAEREYVARPLIIEGV